MSLKSASINIRDVQFIDGNQLENIKRKAYENTRGLPMVAYGDILNKIEVELSNYNPTGLYQQQVKKYISSDNLYLVEVSDAYRFRPDLLSYIFYGSVEYFHIILTLNQMKSFLEFNPNNTNNLIFVFKEDIIDKILNF